MNIHEDMNEKQKKLRDICMLTSGTGYFTAPVYRPKYSLISIKVRGLYHT